MKGWLREGHMADDLNSTGSPGSRNMKLGRTITALLVITGAISCAEAQFLPTPSASLNPSAFPPAPMVPFGSLVTSQNPSAVPPAAQIVDANGAVWTLGPLTGDGLDYQILRDGVNVGSGAGISIYFNGSILTQNAVNSAWYQWNDTSQEYVFQPTDPRPGGSAVPPRYAKVFEDLFATADVSTAYPVTVADANKWYIGPFNALNCCLSDTTGTPLGFYTNGSNGTTWPFSALGGGGLDITQNYFPAIPIISSGSISTWPAFSQQYGYWEITSQFPSGLGVWPAIWMLPTNGANNDLAGGEIDIQEGHSIADTPTQMSITLHDYTSMTDPVPGYYSIDEPTTDTYHVYSMLWTPQLMTFYFDNQPVWSWPTPSVMNTPYYLIINLGLGAGWPAGPGITPFPQDMLVKSVRVYQGQ